MEERRSQARQLTCIPAHVESDDESPHLALIHDVSTKGALLFTRSALEVGEEVQLALYLLPEHDPPRPARGKVVRVQRRAQDRSDIWRWEAGIEFDDPITEYAREIEDLSRRARAVGVLKD